MEIPALLYEETWAATKVQEKKMDFTEMQNYDRGEESQSLARQATKELEEQQKWGNLEESSGKEVEMVWACGEKRCRIFKKERDGSRSTRKEKERKGE